MNEVYVPIHAYSDGNADLYSKVNEIVSYINEQEKIEVEEDESKYTPDWELMYTSLSREYNQLYKENKKLKEDIQQAVDALTAMNKVIKNKVTD